LIINEQTASAAEILAAALQDNNRARLTGNRSYGKGSVQSLIYTATGAIQITTSLNYRPSGEAIHEIGVKPDNDPLPNVISKASMSHSSGSWQASRQTADQVDEANITDHYIKEAVKVLKAQLKNSSEGTRS
jgi:carboxyl-terminal processing protease